MELIELLLIAFSIPNLTALRPLDSSTFTSKPSMPSYQPRIAIIGGGAAGLAAARVFSRNGIKPVVLEKDDSIGGVWRHEPQSATKPMYQGLRTNLPKEIMAFREFPFPKLPKSFVTHREVLQYLQEYAKTFELEQYIRTNSKVNQLTVLPSDNNNNMLSNPTWPKIRLEWMHNQQAECDVFDAVCICNGHYSVPVIPDIPGLSTFQGRTLHSIAYDSPEEFRSQTVLCVGGRASGSDLAREMAPWAKHVYLADTTQQGDPLTRYNVTWVPKLIEVSTNGTVSFENCSLSPKVDTIIFCTGYEYAFPFINDQSNLQLQLGGRRVMPIYEQLWHAHNPNIAFMGLPHSILPFPLFELQAEAIQQQWCHQWTLPKEDEMLQAALDDAESGGKGKENGRIPEDTHYLGAAQWDYCRRLAEITGIYDDKLEDYLMTNKAIWDHSSAERNGSFPGGPDDYRYTVYEREDPKHSFGLIHSLQLEELWHGDAQ